MICFCQLQGRSHILSLSMKKAKLPQLEEKSSISITGMHVCMHAHTYVHWLQKDLYKHRIEKISKILRKKICTTFLSSL